MKTWFTTSFLLALLLLSPEARALDTGFPYQGRLYTNGVAANGVFDLQFQLFGAGTGGAALASVTVEDQGVTNGFFSVRVDFGGVAFTGDDRWLEVGVREGSSTGAFEALGTRRPLLPVPHALHAVAAANLTGSAAAQFAATNAALVQQFSAVSNVLATALTGTNLALVAQLSSVSNQLAVSSATASNALQLALVATNNALAAAVTTATNQAVANLLAGANTFTAAQTVAGTLFADTVSGRGAGVLELQVDGARALRVEPSAASPNLIGGAPTNAVTNGFVGAVIAGGGNAGKPQRVGANYTVISGGAGNTSRAEHATVAGGQNNVAGGDSAFVGGGDGNSATAGYAVVAGGAANTASSLLATVTGGQQNVASANFAAVLGGNQNTASGAYSAVVGGDGNVASGSYALAAGRHAQATNSGAFVFADSVNAAFGSSRTNEFAARATGGVRFVSAVNGAGTPVAGVSLAPTATAWSIISDREAKKDFAPVDSRAVLEKLAAMPVQAWRYRWEDAAATPHLGPVAQDFKAAFFPGRDERSITTLEFDGVELAAIQGLNQKLEAELKTKDAELAELRRSLGELRRLVEQLQVGQGGAR